MNKQTNNKKPKTGSKGKVYWLSVIGFQIAPALADTNNDMANIVIGNYNFIPHMITSLNHIILIP